MKLKLVLILYEKLTMWHQHTIAISYMFNSKTTYNMVSEVYMDTYLRDCQHLLLFFHQQKPAFLFNSETIILFQNVHLA